MIACEACARPGNWQRHHPTGKGFNDKYLDPKLTMPLCHDHHTLVHDDLNTLDLTHLAARVTLIEQVIVRLRRLAAALARIDGATLWRSLATAATRWAEELAVTIRGWDERDPGWREDDRFYPGGPRYSGR